MTIDVKDVSKTFDRFAAVADVSLRVEDGEVVALLGPSGSGKTTLLRIIAGLTMPDRGRVFIDDRDVTDEDVRSRRIGFVFQHYALFRHMSVFENIAFGPKVRQPKPPGEEIKRRVEELLGLVQLDGLGHRLPSQLSGGQRQRVALARALAIEPRVLLLDEPFGALDAQVRKELRRWLRQLHDELGVTSIFVTHDQEEAMEVADRIVVMNKGTIEQTADPVMLYDEPATPFVFEFIGSSNKFEGQLSAGELTLDAVRFPALELAHVEGPALAYVRPNDSTLAPAGSPGFAGILRHVVGGRAARASADQRRRPHAGGGAGARRPGPSDPPYRGAHRAGAASRARLCAGRRRRSHAASVCCCAVPGPHRHRLISSRALEVARCQNVMVVRSPKTAASPISCDGLSGRPVFPPGSKMYWKSGCTIHHGVTCA